MLKGPHFFQAKILLCSQNVMDDFMNVLLNQFEKDPFKLREWTCSNVNQIRAIHIFIFRM